MWMARYCVQDFLSFVIRSGKFKVKHYKTLERFYLFLAESVRLF